MPDFLVPRIDLADLKPMISVAILGAIIAGGYGIAHDQITYSIGPEYFTKLKFKQFAWMNFGLPERCFVSEIGFLASWWVGFAIAWFLGRRLIPNQTRQVAYRQIAIGFGIVLGCGFVAGVLGYAYGIFRGPNGNYIDWQVATLGLGITDIWSFVRVAYIHNASYLGGLIGLVVALIGIRPHRSPVGQDPSSGGVL